MSQEALSILVPLFTAVLVAFMTFFFTKSHYGRKRKDDLADRDFNRRAVIHDRRIDEARACVNGHVEILSKLERFQTELIKNATPEKFVMFMREHHQEYAEINKLMEQLGNSLQSINLIDDDRLRDLLMTLELGLLVETTNPARIVGAIGGLEFFKKEYELERVSDFSTKAYSLATKIQARLDELAKTVP